MKKLFLLILLALAIVFCVVVLAKNKTVLNTDKNKISVSASFYPYYFFASEIGGDKANVVNITKAGTEPHDYDLTAQDIVQIQSSKIIVLNGKVEPWSSKIKDILKSQPTDILFINSSLFSEQHSGQEDKQGIDPHIWLSPRLAKVQVDEILREYIKVDSQNTAYYTQNADVLKEKLDKLDQEYKNGLSSCRTNKFITSHSAFAYLANDYGLIQVSIAGLSPDSEPSLKELTSIAEFARKNNVKYIFFESLVSPKLSETLAAEVGAQTLVLNPIEGLTPDQIAQGKNYLTIMVDNLQNLRTALGCI